MSFWDLNDGTAAQADTSYEVEGGDMKPIPANTTCIAAIEEAKWSDYEGDRFINLKWRVMRPSDCEKRVIFHKIKVYGTSRDKDPQATADKAKRMLAAIDANAGGRLMKVEGEPGDMDLMSALVGKMMAIKLQVWSLTTEKGEEKTGNWVSAVAPAKGAQTEAPAQQSQPVTDDDVPF